MFFRSFYGSSEPGTPPHHDSIPSNPLRPHIEQRLVSCYRSHPTTARAYNRCYADSRSNPARPPSGGAAFCALTAHAVGGGRNQNYGRGQDALRPAHRPRRSHPPVEGQRQTPQGQLRPQYPHPVRVAVRPGRHRSRFPASRRAAFRSRSTPMATRPSDRSTISTTRKKPSRSSSILRNSSIRPISHTWRHFQHPGALPAHL